MRSGAKGVRAFIDTNFLLIGAVNLVLEEEMAETKVLQGLLERRSRLVTSLKQLEEITLTFRVHPRLLTDTKRVALTSFGYYA